MIKKIMCFCELLLVAFFVSCTSHDEALTMEKEQAISFNVSTLDVNVQPMSRAANTASGSNLSDVVTRIVYFIYDSSNHLVKEGISNYDPSVESQEFGNIKESIVPGDYTVLFYALGKGNGTCSFFDYGIFNYDSYFRYKDKEVFYYTGNITVSVSDNSFDINLSRKSALLKINITDQVPETISKVVFTITDYYRWYPKNTGTYREQYEYEAEITSSMVQIFEYYFSFPEALSAPSTNIIISAFDSNNKLIGEKLLNIPIYSNKRTIVTGEFFSSLGDRNMNITISDLWDEDVEVPLN